MTNPALLVKGLTIKSRLDFARAEGGERVLQRLRESPGPVGEIAAAPMLSMRQTPLSHYDALCREIAGLLGKDSDETYRRMGAFQADAERPLQNISLGMKTDPIQLLSGLVRHFPVLLAGEAGALTPEPSGERLCRVHWRGHGESSDSLCLAILGYVGRVLENAGVVGVAAGNRECIAHGGVHCAWDFMWEKASGLRRSTVSIKAIRLGTTGA